MGLESLTKRALTHLVSALVIPLLVPNMDDDTAKGLEQACLELQRAEQLARARVVLGRMQQDRKRGSARHVVRHEGIDDVRVEHLDAVG